MRAAVIAALAVALLSPATASAQPPGTPTETVDNYSGQSLLVSGIGVGLVLAGAAAEGRNGEDTTASGALMVTGALTLALGSPILHLAHGNGGGALKSYLLRSGLATAGMIVALAVKRCENGEGFLGGFDKLGCQIEAIGYGMFGGLVVASLFDAELLAEKRTRAWTPLVAPSSDGVQVGAAFRW